MWSRLMPVQSYWERIDLPAGSSDDEDGSAPGQPKHAGESTCIFFPLLCSTAIICVQFDAALNLFLGIGQVPSTDPH